MKKFLITLLSLAFLSVPLCGCDFYIDPIGSSDSSITSEESTDSSDDVELVTIIFQQDGQTDVVRSVEYGKALENVPSPVPQTGYNVNWNITDFSVCTEDMTVTATAIPKQYQAVLKNGSITVDTITVTYDSAYTFPSLSSEDYEDSVGWKYGDNVVIPNTGVWNIDGESTIVLNVKWGSKTHSGNY